MLDYRNLRTVRQLAQECPVVTEGQLRWWIFHAEQNGLAAALIRVGGRVYIDMNAFNTWLEQGRQWPLENANEIKADATNKLSAD